MIDEFINRIKKSLKENKRLMHEDWEIVWMDLKDIGFNREPDLSFTLEAKAKIYADQIKRGVIFPPVVVDREDYVVDGESRLIAYSLLGKNRIPVLRRPRKEGGKLIRDEVYEPHIAALRGREFRPFKDSIKCFKCKKKMKRKKIKSRCPDCEIHTGTTPFLTWALIPK